MKKLDVNFESLKLCSNIKLLKQWVLKTPKNVLLEPTLRKLDKSKNLNEATKLVWDYALQIDCGQFNGKECTRNSWYKGSAIAGMECHSR